MVEKQTKQQQQRETQPWWITSIQKVCQLLNVFLSWSHSWVSLVSKNYEIERAIVQLENEVGQLKQQQGDENKENIRQDY